MMHKHLQAIAGGGVFFALIASGLGSGDAGAAIMFVFGCTYSGLWLQHEQ